MAHRKPIDPQREAQDRHLESVMTHLVRSFHIATTEPTDQQQDYLRRVAAERRRLGSTTLTVSEQVAELEGFIERIGPEALRRANRRVASAVKSRERWDQA
jgi:hypothetical protein